MSDLRKGILKVFLSSTFKDLQPMREKLIERLDGALMSAAMEKFIPTGETSQKIALEELKESDLAVFLISPYYGTDISTCEFISECQADCGMKNKAKKEKISYTWCEYRFARGLYKPLTLRICSKRIREKTTKKPLKPIVNFLKLSIKKRNPTFFNLWKTSSGNLRN